MIRFFPLLAAALLLAGCTGTSPPTRFYTLDAPSGGAPIASLPGLSLGLGPVVLPDTLDRPQIVSRGEPYRLELAEFDRWAGELKANMGRVMAVRLMERLGTGRVYLNPWPRHRRLDYQVRVDVLRFDGPLGGKVSLTGNWSLLDGEGRDDLAVAAFSLTETAPGGDYGAMTEALSGLTLRLADQIAEAVAARAGAR